MSDTSVAQPKEVTPVIDNKWEFEGTKYEKLVVNRTGNIGIPILDPKTKERKIAIVGAEFAWTDDDPFLDHLDLNLRDERGVQDNETVRKRPNIVKQNSNLFDATVQGGYVIKIDEFSEQSEPARKTRDQLLAYAPEIKSDLIDAWLGKFSVERYFPSGTPEVDMLLSEPDFIYLLCKIGDFANPAHVVLLEFKTPNADARRAYEMDTMAASMGNEGGKQVTKYHINNKSKIRFARKYLKSVQGAVLATTDKFDFEASDFTQIGDNDEVALAAFKKQVNPHWLVAIADALNDCFDFAGK